jgi:hypothetical protein
MAVVGAVAVGVAAVAGTDGDRPLPGIHGDRDGHSKPDSHYVATAGDDRIAMTVTRILDPISSIRRRPDMYISLDVPLQQALLSRLLDDLVALDIPSFQVRRFDGWTLVGSTIDWLRCGKFLKDRPLDLFDGPMPFPEGGPNSTRSEAVVRALSEKTVVWGPEECSFLNASGQAMEDDEAKSKCRQMQSLRVVGFLLSDALDAYGSKVFGYLAPWHRTKGLKFWLKYSANFRPVTLFTERR